MTCALLRPVACSVVLLGALIQSPSRLGAQSATQNATQNTTQSATSPAAPQPPRPTPLVLTTTAWPDGGVMPVKYSQAGEQRSPALSWTNVPAGTVSFVLGKAVIVGLFRRPQ